MKITHLSVTGFKNLVDCKINPGDLHVITGCNGTGKSNFLEVIPFVTRLIMASDEERDLLTSGIALNSFWFPMSQTKENLRDFQFEIECILPVNKAKHLLRYTLKLESIDIIDDPYYRSTCKIFGFEQITSKKVGTRGKPKTLLERTADGSVIAHSEISRSLNKFKCKSDMSALHALDVREADDFASNYATIAAFKTAFVASSLIRLDTERFRRTLSSSNRSTYPEVTPGQVIKTYEPFSLLQELQKDATTWRDFLGCLKRLVDIDGLALHESKDDTAATEEMIRRILPKQHGRFLFSSELSNGGAAAIGLLTSLFTLMKKGGVALFEEPENYLHPKAIIELIEVLREFGHDRSVIFSTHSPVALNSMKASEVSVMRYFEDGEFVTTTPVSEIKDATEALNRGILTLGDLHQVDYQP